MGLHYHLGPISCIQGVKMRLLEFGIASLDRLEFYLFFSLNLVSFFSRHEGYDCN